MLRSKKPIDQYHREKCEREGAPVSTLRRSGPIGQGKPKDKRESASVQVLASRLPLGKLEKKVDDLAGARCRARAHCELAGMDNHVCDGVLVWAHIVNRDDKTVRHDPENCLCLCWSRHSELDAQPAYFETLVRYNFPGRMDRLNERRERLEGGGLDYRDRLEAWLSYYNGGPLPAFVADPSASDALWGSKVVEG